MAPGVVFNNFTEDTAKRLYKVYELLANQKANQYGVTVTVETKITRKGGNEQ